MIQSVDPEFREKYERHVGYVVSGNRAASRKDMDQNAIPDVYNGIAVPRSKVRNFKIKDIRSEGERRIGETVYVTDEGIIGLRSIWEKHDDTWLANGLENFPASEADLVL